MDVKKCILKGACYGCLSEGPCQILTDTEADANNQLLGMGSPVEELKDGPEELKGFTAP